jgi:hypothetical protein
VYEKDNCRKYLGNFPAEKLVLDLVLSVAVIGGKGQVELRHQAVIGTK